MTIYLTIMVTVLVATQIIRLIQNCINLHRQNKEIKRHLDWIEDNEVTEADFLTQREVYRMLYNKLKEGEKNDT